jgi:hypothetical protein
MSQRPCSVIAAAYHSHSFGASRKRSITQCYIRDATRAGNRPLEPGTAADIQRASAYVASTVVDLPHGLMSNRSAFSTREAHLSVDVQGRSSCPDMASALAMLDSAGVAAGDSCNATVRSERIWARSTSHVNGGVKGSECGKSVEVVVGSADKTADIVLIVHRTLASDQ